MPRVVKKSASPKGRKPKPPPHRPCSQQPCKKIAAYCRVEGKKGKVAYCADHWKKVVESKRAFANQVTQHAKAEAERRQARKPKRKIRRVKK